MEALAQELELGNFSLEKIISDSWPGNLGLEILAWELQLRNFSLRTLAWELWLRIFGLGSQVEDVEDAWGTALFRIVGEPGRAVPLSWYLRRSERTL